MIRALTEMLITRLCYKPQQLCHLFREAHDNDPVASKRVYLIVKFRDCGKR